MLFFYQWQMLLELFLQL